MDVGLEYRNSGVVSCIKEAGQPVPDREYGENIPEDRRKQRYSVVRVEVSPDEGWHLKHQVGGEDPEGHHHRHLGVV